MFVFLVSVKLDEHNIKHKKYKVNNMGIAQNATAYQQQKASSPVWVDFRTQFVLLSFQHVYFINIIDLIIKNLTYLDQNFQLF